MAERTTIRWRRHQLSTPAPEALQILAGAPRPHPVPGPPAGLPAAQPDSIHLPDLPPTALGKAVTLLRVAAQTEHALMVQYLYAGYSFTVPQRKILRVAVEEMSHLLTVQNLLRFIGEPAHLHRQDFEPPADEAERLFPFDLRLEPASHLSIAKYVVAESPSSIPADVDPDVLAHIVDLATGSGHEPINRVGTLYALLAVVVGSEQLLLELAATGDPWYVAVNQLAVQAAAFYGGRAALHLPDSAFDPNSVTQQAFDRDWDRSAETGIDEFRVHVVASRRDALEALRDIGLQGEGPSTAATETAHFHRFYQLFVQFFGATGTGTNPPPGVLDVPAGSRIILDEGSSGDSVISHPTTIRWARLADLRYAILLASLERYLRAPTEDRAFLRGWCFAEMFALGKLADFLSRMPRGAQSGSKVAALPFTLPGWLAAGAQWSDLVAAFEASLAIAQDLHDVVGTAPEHRRMLTHLLASDERKLQEAKARVLGTTQRTRTDAVRDALDWAAGAGDPGHSEQGRFWNLQHDDLIRVEVSGENVTTRPSAGEDAPLIAMLRQQVMPKGRPKLPPESDEFRLLDRWVSDGCPDDRA